MKSGVRRVKFGSKMDEKFIFISPIFIVSKFASRPRVCQMGANRVRRTQIRHARLARENRGGARGGKWSILPCFSPHFRPPQNAPGSCGKLRTHLPECSKHGVGKSVFWTPPSIFHIFPNLTSDLGSGRGPGPARSFPSNLGPGGCFHNAPL